MKRILTSARAADAGAGGLQRRKWPTTGSSTALDIFHYFQGKTEAGDGSGSQRQTAAFPMSPLTATLLATR